MLRHTNRSWRQIARLACASEASRCLASTSADQLSAIKSLRERSGAPMSDVRAALQQANWQMDGAMDALRQKGLAASSKKAGRNAAQGLVGLAIDGNSAALVEINSETDFVARNDKFVELVGHVAAAALQQETRRDGGAVDVDELSQSSVEGGSTVSAAVDEVAAVVREKMALRRAARLTVPGGVLGTYLHASPAPGTGRMAALVGIACKKEHLEGKVADEARELASKLAMHVVAMRPPYLSRETVPESVRNKEAVLLQRQAADSGKPEKVLAKMVLGRLSKFYQDVCLLEQPYVADDSKNVQKVMKEFGDGFGCDLHVTGFVRMQVGEDLQNDVNAKGEPTEMASTVLG